MKTKDCLVCNRLIVKKQNVSLRFWDRTKYCSATCRANAMKGRKLSQQTRQKMGKSHLGNKSRKGEIYTLEQRKKLSDSLPKGKNHWNWKGGITESNHLLRNSLEFKLWRTAVFTRDNYTCIWCGARNGNGKKIELHADHIQEFAFYPALRFAIDNGRTLCKPCHKKRHSK